jgi:uncharacterized protein
VRTSEGKIDVGSVLVAGREIDVREQIGLPPSETLSFLGPAKVALTVRKLAEGLELEGTVDVEAIGTCGRCLDDLRFPLHLDVEERVEAEAERSETLGESNLLSGDELDLSDLIRQLIDSALPMVVLCAEDCPGLCPTCGRKRDGSCTCPPPTE